jgi:hypothetical protein
MACATMMTNVLLALQQLFSTAAEAPPFPQPTAHTKEREM